MKKSGDTYRNNSKSIDQLRNLLARIIEHESSNDEIQYRSQKIYDCLGIAKDKFFMKTLKAESEIRLSIELAEKLLVSIDSDIKDKYIRLTNLEIIVNSLLKATYEFRVKAG